MALTNNTQGTDHLLFTEFLNLVMPQGPRIYNIQEVTNRNMLILDQYIQTQRDDFEALVDDVWSHINREAAQSAGITSTMWPYMMETRNLHLVLRSDHNNLRSEFSGTRIPTGAMSNSSQKWNWSFNGTDFVGHVLNVQMPRLDGRINEIDDDYFGGPTRFTPRSALIDSTTNTAVPASTGFRQWSVVEMNRRERWALKVHISGSFTSAPITTPAPQSAQYPTVTSVWNMMQTIVDLIPPGGLRVPVWLDRESMLPNIATLTDKNVGDYWYVQDMDITEPGRTGRVWVNWIGGNPNNALTFYRSTDSYYSPDQFTITLTPTGQLTVVRSWLDGVINGIVNPAISNLQNQINTINNRLPTPIPITQGGTGRTTIATGNIWYATSASNISVINAPPAAEVALTHFASGAATVPVWTPLSGAGSMRDRMGLGPQTGPLAPQFGGTGRSYSTFNALVDAIAQTGGSGSGNIGSLNIMTGVTTSNPNAQGRQTVNVGVRPRLVIVCDSEQTRGRCACRCGGWMEETVLQVMIDIAGTETITNSGFIIDGQDVGVVPDEFAWAVFYE